MRNDIYRNSTIRKKLHRYILPTRLLLGRINARVHFSRRAYRSWFRAPAQVPRSLKEITHPLNGHAFRLRHPDAEDHKSREANGRPEEVGAPDIERDEHVGSDADDGELEEPVQRHADRVVDVADTGGEDLRAVEVWNGA